jgi:hypothetical protein
LAEQFSKGIDGAEILVKEPLRLPNPTEWWHIAVVIGSGTAAVLTPVLQKVLTDIATRWTRKWAEKSPDVGREVTLYGPKGEPIKTIRVPPKERDG